MPLAEAIMQMLGVRRPLAERLGPGRPGRLIDRTGIDPTRAAALRQIEEDRAYEAWLQKREMMGDLARTIAGPMAAIPEAPVE